MGTFFQNWGRRLVIGLFVVLGVVLVADAVGWFLGVPLIPINGPESVGQQTIARESQCDVHHRSPVPKTESAVCAVHDYNSVGGPVEACFAAGVPIARGVAALWVDDHA